MEDFANNIDKDKFERMLAELEREDARSPILSAAVDHVLQAYKDTELQARAKHASFVECNTGDKLNIAALRACDPNDIDGFAANDFINAAFGNVMRAKVEVAMETYWGFGRTRRCRVGAERRCDGYVVFTYYIGV